MAQRDPMSARPDMSVDEMIELIENAPPGPWPNGWAGWPNVVEAHKVMLKRFAASLKPSRNVYPVERGIVIGGGGVKYFPSVWVCVRMLRYLGCELPIQLWYLGDTELDDYMKRLLAPYGVECIDAYTMLDRYPCRILCGWELKPYATLYSPFAQVLYLDADNTPVRDPTYLFDCHEFATCGAVFWPDYDNWILSPDVWDIFDMPHMRARASVERPFESGQYLIDKTRCWRELRLALFFAEHSDYVFRVVYGDKECFHLAWRYLKTEYAMPRLPPGWSVHTILQYDFDDQLVFQHRCQDKWKLSGDNAFNPELLYEDLCFGLVRELAEIWRGNVWENITPNQQEQQLINQLTGKLFLYRRVGHDERLMRLDIQKQIGLGSARMERYWDVFCTEGKTRLVIRGETEPTCILELHEDGVWRGRWLKYEKMPIELIPVEDANDMSRRIN